MKRSLTAVVIVMALLVTASASAAGKKYVGEVEGGGKMSFKIVKRDGRKVVTRFQWSDIPLTCNDGEHTYDATFFIPIRLNNDRFAAAVLTEDRTGRGGVKGEVHGRQADGFINAQGRIPHDDGVGEGCITGSDGKAKWHAERV